jgi:hypothetical protein
MAKSSSIDTHQTDVYTFGKFMIESLEARPMLSFLVLVSIYILSISGATWLMVHWLTSSTSDKVPQKDGPSIRSADTVKAGSNNTNLSSEKE